ncbi:MAG: DUF104 domain-containing protein [Candidatus Omnitrophica bacterium]|nr:DUF104 domain-containing protein [Candidatus Omnitrophota bacterium]
MTKLLSAVYEHGQIKPDVSLDLAEHQKVFVAVVISEGDTPGLLIAQTAQKSKSFDFLTDPREDIYSMADGNDL